MSTEEKALQSLDNAELSDSLTSLAGLLLSEEKLEAILELVVSLTARTLPNADGVSVTLVRSGRFSSATYSNELTRRVDSWQYATSQGPCLEAAKTGKTFLTCDTSAEPRWPDFSVMAKEEGVRSVLSVPFLPMGEPIGTLNTYSRSLDAFSQTDVETATMFAEQAAIVIANSVAYSSAVVTNDQLRDALDSREVIGQAKGILMEREKISADDAFGLLKQVSQRTNRKLRQVAQDVLDSTENGA
jgi:GAF domain-containing protein